MKKYVWIALSSFALGLLVAGYLFISRNDKSATTPEVFAQRAPAAASTNLFASPAPEIKANLDFVAISEKVGPAVVKILADRREKARGMMGPEEGWPFGDDWWDRFFGQPRPRPQEEIVPVQGTGFFISDDGYILTNNHIVENAVKVTLNTVQGQEFEAKVIGADARTDLALLKIEAKGLPFAELGDSAQMKVGEWVLAIGNPYGMDHTLTAGIVSAKGRNFDTGSYQDFIQTDAAINRGNSGGPLINLKGEVIGITSNIFTPTGGSIGIGFAIPSNIAKKVIGQLREKGRVVRGRLGVQVQNITDGMMKQWKLGSKKGALISSVEPGSPAEKANLKQYDVIVAVSGQPVEDNNDLRFKIADVQPGKKVVLTVIRDGKQMDITATADELDPQGEKGEVASRDKDIGLSVTPLTPNLARRYGLRTTEGLLITEVQQSSEAARRGLDVGMIIIEVNRTKVTTVREFEAILKGTEPGDEVILLVRAEDQGQVQDLIIPVKVR